jgi:hypothetical protein
VLALEVRLLAGQVALERLTERGLVFGMDALQPLAGGSSRSASGGARHERLPAPEK